MRLQWKYFRRMYPTFDAWRCCDYISTRKSRRGARRCFQIHCGMVPKIEPQSGGREKHDSNALSGISTVPIVLIG